MPAPKIPGILTNAVLGKVTGAAALLGGMHFTASSLQLTSSPLLSARNNREKLDELKNAGGLSGTWARLKASAAIGAMQGMTNETGGAHVLGGIGGAFKGAGMYMKMRAADVAEVSGFTDKPGLPGVRTALVTGGLLGAGIGAIVGAKFGGGLGRMAASTVAAGLVGGLAAGTGMAKVDLAIAKTVIQARKNILSKGRATRLSNRVKSGGPGYRLWANSMRGAVPMGRPGHLGMNGSLPFAMHKTRNRSTV
jgi:hypothetical protein